MCERERERENASRFTQLHVAVRTLLLTGELWTAGVCKTDENSYPEIPQPFVEHWLEREIAQ